MDSTQFEKLPNSTNAVASYNWFGKQTHREPLKQAMMNTYKKDMAKTSEKLARGRGLCTSYENISQTSCLQYHLPWLVIVTTVEPPNYNYITFIMKCNTCISYKNKKKLHCAKIRISMVFL